MSVRVYTQVLGGSTKHKELKGVIFMRWITEHAESRIRRSATSGAGTASQAAHRLIRQ